MLQDHRGSTEVAKPDCTGTFHRSRGGLRPARISINVVLPAPFAPVTATCCRD
jgi:hypothetical protein